MSLLGLASRYCWTFYDGIISAIQCMTHSPTPAYTILHLLGAINTYFEYSYYGEWIGGLNSTGDWTTVSAVLMIAYCLINEMVDSTMVPSKL